MVDTAVEVSDDSMQWQEEAVVVVCGTLEAVMRLVTRRP
jgi:hypothetical protein